MSFIELHPIASEIIFIAAAVMVLLNLSIVAG